MPVIATMGTEIEQSRPDPGHEVGRAGTARAEAHAHAAGDPGVAVRGVGATLLVPDQDVAELGIVAQDVVQRQHHAARVAEEDVDSLAEQGLAHDVGPDPGPVEGPALVEHVLACPLDRGGAGRPVGWHMAGATRRLRRVSGHRHRGPPSVLPSRRASPTRRG